MTTTKNRPATDRQRDYLRSLLERVGQDTDVADMADLTSSAASTLIDVLIPKAKDVAPRVTPIDVDPELTPAGCYRLGFGGEDITVKVDRPISGRWAGHVFVKQLDDDFEHRLSRADTKGVLAVIAAMGAKESSAEYGRYSGVCGVCHRTLTNPASIDAGIGPVCASRF